MSDLYHQQLLEAAREAHGRGSMSDPDKTIKLVNASCGDTVEVFIKFSPDHKTISDIKWQGAGCIISQASISMLAQELIGMPRAKIAQLDENSLLDLVGLPSIAPGRKKCLHLGLEAIKKTLQ